MFCNKCGAPLNDDAVFCSNCGARVEKETAQNVNNETVNETVEASNEAPAAEEASAAAEAPVAEEAPAAAEAPVAAEAPAAPEAPVAAAVPAEKPKKKISGKAIGILAAVVVVIAVLACNLKAVANTAMKLILSPEKYFAYVISSNANDAVKDAVSAYGDYVLGAHDPDNVKVSFDAEAKLGNAGKELVSSLGEAAEYIEWIDKLNIGGNVNIHQDGMSTDANVGVNGQQILSLGVMLNSKGDTYISIPELVKKAFTVGSAVEELADPEEVFSAMKDSEGISKSFPAKASLERIAKNYVATAVNAISEVDKTNGKELKAEGVSEKVTVLKLTVDSKLECQIEKAICKEILNDNELKKVLKDIYEEISEMPEASAMFAEDFESVYEDFMDEVSEEIENLDSKLDVIKADKNNNREYGKLKIYVDAKGNIAGIDYGSEYGESFAYRHVVKGGEFGFLVEYNDGYDRIAFTGSGKETGSTISGEFEFKEDDEKLFEITVNTLDKALYETGKGNYDVVLSASSDSVASELHYATGIPTSTLRLALGYDISLKGTVKPDNYTVTVGICDDDDEYGNVTLTCKVANGSKVSVPSAKNAINIAEGDKSDILDDIADAIDKKTIVKALKKANAPEDMLDSLEDFFDEIDDGEDLEAMAGSLLYMLY